MKETKGRKQILYKLLIVAFLAVFLFSLYKIVAILVEYRQGTSLYKELEILAEIDTENLEKINFKALREENRDVKAWLYSEDTVINYPVVQGEDNAYYLYRTANREWNGKGSLFIDYRCENPFLDFNTIIYGHRMKDGSMFHSLTKYESKDYYEKHPVMQLITPDHSYDVEIFAAVRIPADSPLYQWQFSGKNEKEKYLSKIREKSLIHSDVQVTARDRIVMLSTCTYEFEDARLAVYGKLKKQES